MKIILQKLYKYYGSYTRIIKILPPSTFKKLKNNGVVRFHTLCKRIDICVLNYTLNDFLQDYEHEIELYKEKELLFQIYSLGYSIEEYAKMKAISLSALRYALISGITNNLITSQLKLEMLNNKTITFETIKNFRCIIHDSYCKLIGSKSDLEKFRTDYNISYPVLQYMNSYHLAFDGYWFRQIKKLEEG